MNSYNKRYGVLLLLAGVFLSCGKEEHKPFDEPFVHIMENEASVATVNYQATVLRTYHVYLSSAPQTLAIDVEFRLTPGNGLREGVDYEVLTPGHILTFLPGIYDMPIRIRWLPSPAFDATKDNTLTIELVGNNRGITMGLPGPDQRQRTFVITKLK